MATWTNWARLSHRRTRRRRSRPHDAGEVVDAVVAARHQNLTVKMPGTGHSFTDIAADRRAAAAARRPARHHRRRPGRDDRDRARRHPAARAQRRPGEARPGRCTTWATSTSRRSPAPSRPAPTAPAASVASLSAQVAGLELVTGDGELLQRRRRSENPDVLDVARLGLGALGILTSVTFEVEPMFTLEAHEAPMLWDEALAGSTSWPTDNHHFEMYWFPHTDRLLTKRNNRTLDDARAAVAAQALARRRVPLQPRLRLGQPARQPPARAWSAGSTTSPAGPCPSAATPTCRTRCSPRRRTVVFREMEYAVPREVGLEALREVRALIDAQRLADQLPGRDPGRPADDVPLSTAYERDSVYLAFHMNAADRPHRLLRAASRRSCAATTAARTGASCTPAPPPTSRRRTRAGRTSRRCATGSTPTGSSPTPTSTGSRAPDAPQTLADPLRQRCVPVAPQRQHPQAEADDHAREGDQADRQAPVVARAPPRSRRAAPGSRRARWRRPPAPGRRAGRGPCRRRSR